MNTLVDVLALTVAALALVNANNTLRLLRRRRR